MPGSPQIPDEPNTVASRIADQFFEVTSLFHADLRRQIEDALEAERALTEYYICQMGRWVKQYNAGNPSFSHHKNPPPQWSTPGSLGDY